MIFHVFMAILIVIVNGQADLPMFPRNCQTDCGTTVCNPCALVQNVDFVFMIDGSSSMQAPIETVRRGLTAFTDSIIERDISARYSIIMFGLFPEVILDFVDDGYLCRDGLAQVHAAAWNNFTGPQADADISDYNGNPPTWMAHFNHDCVGCNTREASFETISMALGKSAENTMLRRDDSLSAQQTGPIQWRAGSRKFVILVTNEDSDCPFFEANKLFDASLTGDRGGAGRQCPIGQSGGGREDNKMNPPNPFPLTRDGSVNDLWRDELDATAQSLITEDVSINMWVKPTNVVRRQFGDPALAAQNADFSDFDAAATLAALTANPNTTDSLQAQVLRNNLEHNIRLFDIGNLNGDTTANFFAQVVESVSLECNLRKREVEQMNGDGGLPCFEYRCRCDVGCIRRPLCNPGCEQCRVTNDQGEEICVEGGAFNPNNFCETCKPSISRTGYTGCDDLNACTDDACENNQCKSTPRCSAECGFCNIDDECIPRGNSRDILDCEVCDPTMNFDRWTRTEFCTEAPTTAPTPEPTAPTAAPTEEPTPAPTNHPGDECTSFTSCTPCIAEPDSLTKRDCRWCYQPSATRDDQGLCFSVDTSCSASGSLTATATTGTCPSPAPTNPPTNSPTAPPTTAPPTTAPPTAEPTPAPTADPADKGNCHPNMAVGDIRVLTDDNGATRHCVCMLDRTLTCADDPNACILVLNVDDCNGRSDCCHRTLTVGSVCLPADNPLCSSEDEVVTDSMETTPRNETLETLNSGNAQQLSFVLIGLMLLISTN